MRKCSESKKLQCKFLMEIDEISNWKVIKCASMQKLKRAIQRAQEEIKERKNIFYLLMTKINH